MDRFSTVDAYIKRAPADVREKLSAIRSAIRKTVPKAKESISYRMPYYAFNGRLAYFGYAKDHIGLYIPPPIFQQFAEELKGYSTSKGTLRLPLDKKIPLTLVSRLVRARAEFNIEKHP